MNRRSFLKLALLTSGVAIAGYYGADLWEMANASVRSLPSQHEPDEAVGSFSISADWQVPHLLRRAGFGGSPDELSSFEQLGFPGSVDYLLNYEIIGEGNLPNQPNITMSLASEPQSNEVVELVSWWVNRMVNTPRALEEKMTLFWHNRFATAIYKVRSPFLMFEQNQLLRSKAMGNFEDLLMGVTEGPAMLIWLDGASNRAGAPNENYGREVMEVFTIGRGNYTEDDVKAAARAFTGYTLDKNGNVKFNPKLHDNGSKTFLGNTGDLGPQDVVRILANHLATAKAIASQLFQYFVYDSPSNDVVNRLAQVYTSTNGNIKAVVEAILKSEEFISEQSHLALVKSPIEFVVTALRSLGATVDSRTATFTLNNMGQLPFNPPSVFGWPSGLAWINTATILDRINFPLAIQNANVSRAPTESSISSAQNVSFANYVGRVLFPEGLPQEVIQSIDASTSSLPTVQDRERNALRLTMGSPYYNLN